MTVRLTERRLRLKKFGTDIAFDHNFGLCRDHQIDRLRFNGVNRGSGKSAGDGKFIGIFR